MHHVAVDMQLIDCLGLQAMLKYDSSSREVRLTVDRDYQEGTCLPYILVTVCLQHHILLSSMLWKIRADLTYLLHSVTR